MRNSRARGREGWLMLKTAKQTRSLRSRSKILQKGPSSAAKAEELAQNAESRENAGSGSPDQQGLGICL